MGRYNEGCAVIIDDIRRDVIVDDIRRDVLL